MELIIVSSLQNASNFWSSMQNFIKKKHETEKYPHVTYAPFKKAESPYGETKQKCEILINKNLCNNISLRYFNPIGSHESS